MKGRRDEAKVMKLIDSVPQTVASFNSVSLLLRDFFNYTSPGSWAEWET